MMSKIVRCGFLRCSVMLLVSLSLVGADSTVNYCGAKMCGHLDSHTFCMFHGGPGIGCAGYLPADLTPMETSRILDRLNQRRNAAASGRLRGFPAAGNMIKLRWVGELAREAQLWADQCSQPANPEERDMCRDLYSISVGQCVASVVGEAPGLRPESMVDMWYMQSIHYKGNITSYKSPEPGGSYYGDFAQIVWANTFMVGCGRSRFMIPWYDRLRSVERLVCNFAPRGPTEGRAMWTPTEPASACPPRSLPDKDFPALCDFQHDLDESQDVDNVMTLEQHILLDTVLSVERNQSLTYPGSIDELYLTKLTIATMMDDVDAKVTASLFNSLQKRDILQPVSGILVDKTNASQILNMTNQIITKKNDSIAAAKKAKKVRLIGRPKSYNIEDLTNENAEESTENHQDIPVQDIAIIRDKEMYAEYEFSESNEESTTMLSINAEDGIYSPGNATVEYANLNVESVINATSNETAITVSMSDQQLNVNDNSDVLAKNSTVSKVDFIENVWSTLNMSADANDTLNDKLIEEYLSDPENARQMQEELDRMEQAMSTSVAVTTSERKGKMVRRELKRFPEERFNPSLLQGNPESNNSFDPIQALIDGDYNKSEQTPMLNMVFRYMPYLKEYKNSFLHKPMSDYGVRSHRNNILVYFFVLGLILLF